MVQDFLHQQLTNVLADFQAKLKILLLEYRQNDIGQYPFARWNQMQAAYSAKVGLNEAQRILPHRADEIHHRVKPAENRIILALARSPTLPEPLFLARR